MLAYNSLGHYGRFGNQLFQIAGTIGIARKYGYAYGFPEWKNHDHKDRFGSQEDIDLQKYFVNPLPQVDAVGYPDYPVSWGYHPDLHPPDNVSLSGHFQSEKYFAHCKDVIRHYFRMKYDWGDHDGCAIHVRLGDYDDKYHPRLTAEYYNRAMALFPEGTKFTVFSDDLDAACKMFDLRKVGYNHSNDYIIDFAIMKKFKHFIIGNSSYSLMAAILGEHPDKKIICPSNWFGTAWGANYRELSRDIYPKNSIII